MFNLIYDMLGGAVKNLLSYFFVAIHPVHHASDGVNLCYTSFKRIVSNMSGRWQQCGRQCLLSLVDTSILQGFGVEFCMQMIVLTNML